MVGVARDADSLRGAVNTFQAIAAGAPSLRVRMSVSLTPPWGLWISLHLIPRSGCPQTHWMRQSRMLPPHPYP